MLRIFCRNSIPKLQRYNRTIVASHYSTNIAQNTGPSSYRIVLLPTLVDGKVICLRKNYQNKLQILELPQKRISGVDMKNFSSSSDPKQLVNKILKDALFYDADSIKTEDVQPEILPFSTMLYNFSDTFSSEKTIQKEERIVVYAVRNIRQEYIEKANKGDEYTLEFHTAATLRQDYLLFLEDYASIRDTITASVIGLYIHQLGYEAVESRFDLKKNRFFMMGFLLGAVLIAMLVSVFILPNANADANAKQN